MVAALLLEHGHVAERPTCRPPRLVERHPARDVLGDEEIEVKGELARHLGVDDILPDEGPTRWCQMRRNRAMDMARRLRLA